MGLYMNELRLLFTWEFIRKMDNMFSLQLQRPINSPKSIGYNVNRFLKIDTFAKTLLYSYRMRVGKTFGRRKRSKGVDGKLGIFKDATIEKL